jgi:hypothetical protein
MRLPRPLIRIVFTFLQKLRKLLWLVTGPGRDGVHAVPLTGHGTVVLVWLTYAKGWRLPGGGRKRGETPEEGMLRELREEIGLVGHGSIERLEDVRPGALPGDRSAMFLVRRARPSKWRRCASSIRPTFPTTSSARPARRSKRSLRALRHAGLDPASTFSLAIHDMKKVGPGSSPG